MDKTGNLYGTTFFGGRISSYCNEAIVPDCSGVVFELSRSAGGSWTEKVLHTFCSQTDCTDGEFTEAGLTMDDAGNLYGTSGAEGPCCGDVFELTPIGNTWTFTVLYSFRGAPDDAAYPAANLIIDKLGNLYGTTEGGGASDDGAVFKLTPKQGGGWIETVLYSFCSQVVGGVCVDGVSPQTDLVMDSVGNLYGTTFNGGTGSCFNGSLGCGVVFELTSNTVGGWTETVLHDFCSQNNCADGGYSETSLIMDPAGNLYGTTPYGGSNLNAPGTVFKLAQDGDGWLYSVLYNFCSQTGCTGGFGPAASLIFDAAGALYGTTVFATNGYGAVFELSGAGVPLSENPQTNDFNAHGKSDILLQNATSGEIWMWEMNGLSVIGAGSPDNPGPGWKVIGAGDFYGSLYSDILAQNTTSGEVWIWEMNGNKVAGKGSPGNLGPSWRVVGTGDFNGDGYSDILLQNTTSGEIWIWEMNGLKVIASGSPDNPGPSWHVIGTGDFNGDGYSDILAQNTTSGEAWIWEMNGLKVIGKGSPGNLGPNWHVIGTGDFNGDGYSDILLQNATSGEIWIWEMNGLKVIASGSPDNPGPSWRVVGTGDFNSDGYSDILAQNTSGEVWIWEMSGLKVIGKGSPGNLGPSWHAIGD